MKKQNDEDEDLDNGGDDQDPPRKDWYLYKFRTDLRKAVAEEARKSNRTAPKQLEEILAERYGLPVLTEEDKNSGRKQARARKESPTVKRPVKNHRRKDAAA